jgi:hypothetical protein
MIRENKIKHNEHNAQNKPNLRVPNLFAKFSKKAMLYSLITLVMVGSLFFLFQTIEARTVSVHSQNTNLAEFLVVERAVSDIATTYRQIYQIDQIKIAQNTTHDAYQFNGTFNLTSRSTRLSNLVAAYNTQRLSQIQPIRISGTLSDTLRLSHYGYLRIGENNLTIGGQNPSMITINASTNVIISSTNDAFGADPSGTTVRFSLKDGAGVVYYFSKVLNPNQTNENYMLYNGTHNVTLRYGLNNSIYGNGSLSIIEAGMDIRIHNIEILYPNSSFLPFVQTNSSIGITHLRFNLTEGILLGHTTRKNALAVNIP